MSDSIFEFSRPVRLDSLPPAGIKLTIEANEAERAALAERFGLLALDSLVADLIVTPLTGGTMAEVDGHVKAQLTQACVVTLDPLPASIDSRFHRLYGPPDAPAKAAERDIHISPEDAEPPEPLINGALELGEAVAEELGLALDPFPRKPGAEFKGVRGEAGAKAGPAGPFANLAALKDKLKKP